MRMGRTSKSMTTMRSGVVARKINMYDSYEEECWAVWVDFLQKKAKRVDALNFFKTE